MEEPKKMSQDHVLITPLVASIISGDGVVPQRSAHLDGSKQISLGEEGGFHSVNEPERWYGSKVGVSKWLGEMEEGLAAVAVSE